MDDPVLVEVLRGALSESRHRGAVAVCDADGRDALDARRCRWRRSFPRSAIKAIQALPLIESGAADRFALTPAEIALACASHSGEPVHVETARDMLEKCGQGVEDARMRRPLADRAPKPRERSPRTGAKPSALHNNCSGKHAGFICVSCAAGIAPGGYVGAGASRAARSQSRDRGRRGNYARATRRARSMAVRSRPTPCLCGRWPTASRASAPARAFPRRRAAAAKRIREAVAAHPVLVAGAGRFDTLAMQALGPRVFVKAGAEGVYCAAFPERRAWRCDQMSRRRRPRRGGRDGGHHHAVSSPR